MTFQPDKLYHIFNQGNNKQTIFYSQDDYLTFLRLTRELIKPQCEIIAYCLMPNHFHFMVVTDERCEVVIQQGGNLLDPLTNGIRKLLSGYARIFNKKYGKSGSLFRQKTKAKMLEDEARLLKVIQPGDYYANCFYYIHLNPFQSGLVAKAEDWIFSSCKEYALLRKGTLVNIEMAKKYCDYSSEYFLKEMYGRRDIGFEM